MMKAYLNLRYTDDRRAKLFEKGLHRLGYSVTHGLPDNPGTSDLFITWNRIGAADAFAKTCIAKGCRVLVAENATWGNDFCGDRWFHIARELHNTKDRFQYYGAERFDSLGIELPEFKKSGETVILPQRGIGSKPVVMPSNFIRRAKKEHGGRIRAHPGRRQSLSLEQDLKNCGKVITWGSGAAIKALLMGIPVISYYPDWIGKQYNTDKSRLDMFRYLAWAQWRHEEIKSGEVFDLLLN